ncbi:hypothetical protein [Micromonospora orduensis]|uniref:hypothetical protein n=1 Tax=Micromonospora orduensis TaxID=1420891 RepID=UPI0033DE4347
MKRPWASVNAVASQAQVRLSLAGQALARAEVTTLVDALADILAWLIHRRRHHEHAKFRPYARQADGLPWPRSRI